jgi:transposase InsO family protein
MAIRAHKQNASSLVLGGPWAIGKVQDRGSHGIGGDRSIRDVSHRDPLLRCQGSRGILPGSASAPSNMIELVSSARRLGREIAPVVGVDWANAGAPARRHRCRRERVRQACSGCWSSGEPGCSQAAPRYIIRDRDCVYGRVFLRRLRAMGIRDRPIAPRSPWQNGCAERLIGSIRRDCLDHVIVFGERHLRHLLKSYQKYYNEARTHLSLQKDAPIPRAVQTVGQTLAVPILGGLHHQYIRA